VKGTVDNPGRLEPAGAGEAIVLDRCIIIVGDDALADARIAGKGIANYHVEILFEDPSYRIRHLDGKADVTVNGRKVEDSVLKDGDSVAIGEHAWHFRRDG
jgi:pSer/pThr/pTyr-binding forkhead associated (FHA) protein